MGRLIYICGSGRECTLRYRFLPAVALIASGCVLGAESPGDLDQSHSEMRATIEKYTADRGSLTRAYPLEISPGRRDRMTKFYREWLDSLPKLNFDSMSEDGRSTTCSSGITCNMRHGSSSSKPSPPRRLRR